MKNFSSLGISAPVIKTLSELGITTPTEIQQKSIGTLIKEKKINFIGHAETGTGKTLAFSLPLLHHIDIKSNFIQALVLAPTRELCQQIAGKLSSYAKYNPEIQIESIVGGAPIKPQIKAFKHAVHIVIATPGRLLDLMQQQAIDLSQTKTLVLDEADEMLSLGFKEGIEKIIQEIHKEHATWLFSATIPGELKQMIQKYMKAPIAEVLINKDLPSGLKIDHQYLKIDPIEKFEMLAHFLNEHEEGRGIIFCRTKAAVQKLHKQLAINKFSSGALHGDLPQGLRNRMMDQFKAEQIRILVASDVAARGIDIKDLAFVIHYHLPESPEIYTHRSGRTGRANKSGVSLSFVFKEELAKLRELEAELGIKIRPIEKPKADSIESNNVYLWAKRIHKVRPDKNIDKDLRGKIGSVFQMLSKDELIDRLVTEQLASKKITEDPRMKN